MGSDRSPELVGVPPGPRATVLSWLAVPLLVAALLALAARPVHAHRAEAAPSTGSPTTEAPGDERGEDVPFDGGSAATPGVGGISALLA